MNACSGGSSPITAPITPALSTAASPADSPQSAGGRAGASSWSFYAADLAAAEKRVREAGGVIVQDTFSFPGGRRFHFADPAGNELAVWSE